MYSRSNPTSIPCSNMPTVESASSRPRQQTPPRQCPRRRHPPKREHYKYASSHPKHPHHSAYPPQHHSQTDRTLTYTQTSNRLPTAAPRIAMSKLSTFSLPNHTSWIALWRTFRNGSIRGRVWSGRVVSSPFYSNICRRAS